MRSSELRRGWECVSGCERDRRPSMVARVEGDCEGDGYAELLAQRVDRFIAVPPRACREPRRAAYRLPS